MEPSDFSRILDGYAQRVLAGETVGRLELEEEHPAHAEALWEQVRALRHVGGALPGGDEREPGLAIHFLPEDEEPSAEALWSAGGDPREVARRIAARGGSIGRYEVVQEIARGAMGGILGVRDTDLGRELAMKVMLTRRASGEAGTPGDAAVARFIEEARITGRLEHPGIPAVHDFGVDAEGNFYFTMPWVRGMTLGEVFRRVHAGDEAWDRERAVELLARICDAVAFAHSRGVVHRDLKPRNVMVGAFGAVYVMDWGLARDGTRPPRTARGDVQPEREPRSPVVTADGVVLGTPSYMSPEQARGANAEVGASTDVYALGAILYELLAGHPPYAPKGSDTSAYGIVQRVQDGPPRPIAQVAGDAPQELVAICERAMERDLGARFASAADLGADLRAYLEGRVVRSHATGPLVELRKWVRRNPWTAGLSAALLLLVVAGALVFAGLESARRRVAERELDGELAGKLIEASSALGVLVPGAERRLEAWVRGAEGLVAKSARYEAELAAFERGHAGSATQPNPEPAPGPRGYRELLETRRRFFSERAETLRRQLAEGERPEKPRDPETYLESLEWALLGLEASFARMDAERAAHRETVFVDAQLDARHAALHDLVHDLRWLGSDQRGGLAEMRERLAAAREVTARTLVEAAGAWEEVRLSMSDSRRSPLYGGVPIEPVRGLVPLEINEAGLWEFWLPCSGVRPERRADGGEGWSVEPETGLVFVLVPGGRYSVGGQSSAPALPNYCAPRFLGATRMKRDEGPVREVVLDPFFLSKYELTQAQYRRLRGEDPSYRCAAGWWGSVQGPISATHPVESVTWTEARAALALWGCDLPTLSQSEAAARAGTRSAFGWGEGWPPPADKVNLADRSLDAETYQLLGFTQAADGYALHAPVDSMPPNAWGLHHTTGNVSEWCLDYFAASCYDAEVVPKTGELLPDHGNERVHRGGNFTSEFAEVRLSRRRPENANVRRESLGVRAVFAFR